MQGANVEILNQGQRLSWRLDPEESFSDYTIRVTRRQQVQKTGVDSSNRAKVDQIASKDEMYHVHRAILSFGPYPSGYFKTAIRQRHMAEGETRCTHMTLSDEEADLIPIVLDCMYGGMYNSINVESVRPDQAKTLYWLLDYLDMPELMAAALSKTGVPAWTIEDLALVLSILENGHRPLKHWCLKWMVKLSHDLEKNERNESMQSDRQLFTDAIGMPSTVSCLLDILAGNNWGENLRFWCLHTRATIMLLKSPPAAIISFPGQLSAILRKVINCAFDDDAMDCIGDFVAKTVEWSVDCFDEFVDAGMIEALIFGAMSCRGSGSGYKAMSRALLMYPARAPIQHFVVGFSDALGFIGKEKEPDTPYNEDAIRAVIVAISKYPVADRRMIIDVNQIRYQC